jgi:tetratricopeptide (TPR) repeat protein
VAEFDNRTADSSLSGSITEAFRIDLGQSQVVHLLTTAQIGDALQRMQRDPATPLTGAVAREVATRAGAKAVVIGEISALGKSYVLSARIINAADGSELVAVRETAADDAGIVAALDKLSSKIRERIGESLKTIRGGEPLEQVTTGSLEALRLYSQGAHLCEHGACEQAIPLLRQAIALDSGFAMAWRKLAVALQNSLASDDEVVAATTRAYQHRDRLPEIERQLTIAYYYSAVDVDAAKTEAAYRRALAISPDNMVATNNLALLLLTVGRPAEAESLVAPLALPERTISNIEVNLLAAQLGQGHDDDVRRTLDRLSKLAPTSPIYLWGKAGSLTAMGEYDAAERAYLDLGLNTRDQGFQFLVHNGLAIMAQTRGKLAEAERQDRLAMGVNERRGVRGGALASAASLALQYVVFRSDTAGALRIVEAALKQYPLDSMPPLDRPGAELAQVYAATGQPAKARQLLTTYEAQVPEGVRRGRWQWFRARGWVALSEGRAPEAVTAFVQGRHTGDCPDCGAWEEGLAFERDHQPDSALAAYQRAAGRGSAWKPLGDAWGLAPSLRRLGELYEEKGDRQKALDSYGRFTELWKDADPTLQPAVREVKARMAKLAGER